MIAFVILVLTGAVAGAQSCASSAPLSRKQIGVIKDLKDPISLGDILPLLGVCIHGDATDGVKKILAQHRQNFAHLDRALARKPDDGDYGTGLPKIQMQEGQMLEERDIVAIDFLARTIFSEIGTREECNAYLPALGGIILNRQDRVMADRKKWEHRLARPGTNPTGVSLVDVVLSPNQFDVWNDSPANAWALCPAKLLSQRYANGTSTGQASHNQWEDAVRVAAEMIIYQGNFRRLTKAFHAINYTSTTATAAERVAGGYKPVKAVLGDHTLPNDPRCMNFWDDGPSKTANAE